MEQKGEKTISTDYAFKKIGTLEESQNKLFWGGGD